MIKHVTERSHPTLEWKAHPKGYFIIDELIQSDAFRSLSKIESDLLLFIYTRRQYPHGKSKMNKKLGKVNYWKPLNGHEMTIPYVAVKEFFDRPKTMKRKAPSESTITRALKNLMSVGFLSPEHIGGNGKGDMNIYRLAHNWRLWRQGDGPCFVKAGMSREKGFCKPGSGVFNPSKNTVKNNKGGQPCMSYLHAALHEKEGEKRVKGVIHA